MIPPSSLFGLFFSGNSLGEHICLAAYRLFSLYNNLLSPLQAVKQKKALRCFEWVTVANA